MNLVRYHRADKDKWNTFLARAKNSHFMFYREYMDYHSDRFIDASLFIYRDKELVALFPANIDGDVVYSHQGLTFGGLIMSPDLRVIQVVELMTLIVDFYHALQVKKIIYKTMPHIYHAYPSEEDLYALHQVKAILVRRDISSVIEVSHQLPFSRLRKRSIAKAIKHNLVVKKAVNFAAYWDLLTSELQYRHQAKPTHRLEEIELLAKAFPENIKLFLTLSSQGTLLAGIVVYINVDVVHVQYVASSEEGRSMGAVDYLVDELMNKKYASKKWFSFGTSAEDAGRSLNQGLVAQKEGFGARGVISDHYQIIISR